MDWDDHCGKCGAYNDLPSGQLEYLLSTFNRAPSTACMSGSRARKANPEP
jgi:hypothetical protein